MKDKVYEPQEDSELLRSVIKDHAKGIVLDMGTGTGILAAEAAKYADKVLAVDKNPVAVRMAQTAHKDKNIFFIQSDLFDVFGTGKIAEDRFDVIIFNPPYLPKDLYPDPALDGGKEGYELIVEFLKQAKKYLKPKGEILLLFSSLSKKPKIIQALEDLGYDYALEKKKNLDFEELYVYVIR